MSLKDKVCLVTAAAQGIGRATVQGQNDFLFDIFYESTSSPFLILTQRKKWIWFRVRMISCFPKIKTIKFYVSKKNQSKSFFFLKNFLKMKNHSHPAIQPSCSTRKVRKSVSFSPYSILSPGALVYASDINIDLLQTLPDGIHCQKLDVTDSEAVVEYCKQFDKVDVLFNVAGWVPHGSVLDTRFFKTSLN